MIILVTGVSSGFGKAIAKSLVSNGHKVFGTVRREIETSYQSRKIGYFSQIPGINSSTKTD